MSVHSLAHAHEALGAPARQTQGVGLLPHPPLAQRPSALHCPRAAWMADTRGSICTCARTHTHTGSRPSWGHRAAPEHEKYAPAICTHKPVHESP